MTRVADFGAFVELEPGVEALAHASTFTPTGKSDGWSKSIKIGTTGRFEIQTIDLEKKRIGVAMRDDAEEVEIAGPEIPAESQAFGTLADKLRSALKK